MLKLLHIPTGPDTLTLADLSTYPGIPDFPRLELAIPGKSGLVSLPFSVGVPNVYTLQQLEAIPDGSYLAYLSVSPHATTRICYPFFRTSRLACKIHSWINTISWELEPVGGKAYTKLARLSALMQAVEAGHPKGGTYYNQALALLKA